jgi:hypothetical protein
LCRPLHREADDGNAATRVDLKTSAKQPAKDRRLRFSIALSNCLHLIENLAA